MLSLYMNGERRKSDMGVIKDDDYETILPSLYPDRVREIEEEIIENGNRESFVLWNDIMLNGDNLRFTTLKKKATEQCFKGQSVEKSPE